MNWVIPPSLKKLVRKKGERSSETGFQPVFFVAPKIVHHKYKSKSDVVVRI